MGNRDVAGIILAGGLSSRMGGGDKSLLELGGRRLLDHVICRAGPQVAVLAINANGDPGRFTAIDLPVVPDDVADFPGPLAGILAGMGWARRTLSGCRWLASFAGDSPLIPPNLVARLQDAAEAQGAEIACAASGGQVHPVVALWSVGLEEDLRHALVEEDIRRIRRWTSRYRVAEVEWDVEPVDPFFNVNTPEEFTRLQALAGAG